MSRKLLGFSLGAFILFNSALFCGQKEEVDLSQFERKFYSQNGEDGVILKLFELLGSGTKYFVEFGVESGSECNTRVLRQWCFWRGLMMDAGYSDQQINLKQEIVTAENINSLFDKYNVPENFDLLSIDIDYNDFHIWNAIEDRFSPRVIVIEYNASHLPNEDKVSVYDPQGFWDGTNYFGGSILALYRLARRKGYSLIYAESQGVNLFFVRDDVLEKSPYSFKNTNCVDLLYKTPKYGRGGHPHDPLNRPYSSSIEHQ